MAKTKNIQTSTLENPVKKSKVSATKGEPSLRDKIASQLEAAFTDLKETVGEKQFKKNVKKASKALTTGTDKKEPEVLKKNPALKK